MRNGTELKTLVWVESISETLSVEHGHAFPHWEDSVERGPNFSPCLRARSRSLRRLCRLFSTAHSRRCGHWCLPLLGRYCSQNRILCTRWFCPSWILRLRNRVQWCTHPFLRFEGGHQRSSRHLGIPTILHSRHCFRIAEIN